MNPYQVRVKSTHFGAATYLGWMRFGGIHQDFVHNQNWKPIDSRRNGQPTMIF